MLRPRHPTDSSPLGASADDLGGAFSQGSFSGDINLHHKRLENSSSRNSGYTTSYLGLKYLSAPFHGTRLGLAFRNGSGLQEAYDGDADEGDNSLLTEAYLHFSGDTLDLTLGRQAIDLEWVGDYHQALVVSTSVFADSELTFGYSHSKAVANPDEFQDSFADIGADGGYFLDLKLAPTDGLILNPYLLHSDDLFTGYGIKAELELAGGFGLTLQGAASDVVVAGESDGGILHLELRGQLGDLALNAGQITTDSDGGIGYLETLGDNINPLEEGNQVYVADATTRYLGAEYSLGRFTLGAIYGISKYGASEEREFNFSAGIDLSSLTDNLSLGLVFADVDAQSSSDDYRKYSPLLSYEF